MQVHQPNPTQLKHRCNFQWPDMPFYLGHPSLFTHLKNWRLPPSVVVAAVVCTFIWTLRALWSSPLSGGSRRGETLTTCPAQFSECSPGCKLRQADLRTLFHDKPEPKAKSGDILTKHRGQIPGPKAGANVAQRRPGGQKARRQLATTPEANEAPTGPGLHDFSSYSCPHSAWMWKCSGAGGRLSIGLAVSRKAKPVMGPCKGRGGRVQQKHLEICSNKCKKCKNKNIVAKSMQKKYQKKSKRNTNE